jgi:hypothetical protein
MARERTTLEDVFVRLTTHDKAGEDVAFEAPAESAAAPLEDREDMDVDGTDDEETPS